MRLGVALAGVLLSWACVEDTPALFIVHNSALNDECEPITQGNPLEFQGAGVMDLTVATRYTMFPLVENLMSPSGSVTLGGQGSSGRGGGSSGYEGNRVTLSSATVSLRGPANLDVPLPRTLRIPLSGTLEPDGNVVATLPIINNALGSQLRSSALLRDRTTSISIEVELRFKGQSTSGAEVESNTFTYPLTICRGCLLVFPLDANDPLDTQPNCRATFNTEDTEVSLDEFDLSCFPGQDSALDCRVCRIFVTAQGFDATTVEQACEP